MDTISEERSSEPLSPTVRALGFVSLFADISSEMTYPINPLFITQVLGAPAWALGIIEGIAESTASLLKLYSGWLSDRMGMRKPFALVGYFMGAIGKPMVGVAGSWWQVLAARFVDRTGKGLRTAPRDALVSENCHPSQRGRAFGFHRSMDTFGAVLGPFLGFTLVRFWLGEGSLSHTFRTLYAVAFVPGILSVVILWAFVRERRRTDAGSSSERPDLPTWRTLSPALRAYLAIVALFSLGNSSDAFLLLRAQKDMGADPMTLLLLYSSFNVVEAALGYPAGKLSDRVGRRVLIALGYGVFSVVYFGFAAFQNVAAVWFFFILYGLYYTLTQGIQRALAADLAHPDRRATEIGAFHMVVGLAALPASFMAGQLYDRVSHGAPFWLGASCAGAAAILLATLPIERMRHTT